MMTGMEPDALLPIGRFSATTRLSIKALRLYDERGLLVPAHVDADTGYRYYAPSQARRAEAIRRLRSVDLPLDRIALVLDGGLNAADDVLVDHRRQLLDRAATLERGAGFLDDVIHGRSSLVPHDIARKTLPPATVASLMIETDLESIGADIGSGFGRLAAGLGAAGAAPTGAPYLVFHDVIDPETSGRVELCIPTGPDVELDGIDTRDAPSVEVASTIHRGRYEDVGTAYHALSGWIRANGLEEAGPPRETYLNDPTEVPEGEQLTEVAWPVREAVS